MTDLRTAAQQALEALEIGYEVAKGEADRYHTAMAGFRPESHAKLDAEVQQIAQAITALRAALAQPTPPPEARFEAELVERLRADNAALRREAHAWWTAARDALRDAPEAQRKTQPAPEPVAWIHTDPDKPRVKFLEWRGDEPGYHGHWIKTPLYTAPPQRKPLTDDRVWLEYMQLWPFRPNDEPRLAKDILRFARAIEATHGIIDSEIQGDKA